MLTAPDRDLALLAALRAEREVADERERTQRLSEARCWEEYLFTTFDQLTARLQRATPTTRTRRHTHAPFRRDAAALEAVVRAEEPAEHEERRRLQRATQAGQRFYQQHARASR